MPKGVCGKNSAQWKHGGYGTRLYRVWRNMKQRCFNDKSTSYGHYGGRDIYVCPEWAFDFATFRDYALSHGYTDTLTVDRIDNNEDYKPGNVRFIPNSQNCCNRKLDTSKGGIITNQLDLKGNLIATYPSVIEAHKQTNIDLTRIYRVCNGKPHCKTAGGFKWEYAS